MTLRLIQYQAPDTKRFVLCANSVGRARIIQGVSTTYELALAAIERDLTIAELIETLDLGAEVDVNLALAEGLILAPIDHNDPTHLHVTGTGLTHLGSAEGRDKMHRAATSGEAQMTDSMRMFLMGMKNGKPEPGLVGAQPEWFYKGNGDTLVGPRDALKSPSFAQDGGEEPEIAGIYVIDKDGNPHRIGYALMNEFSDHIVEKQNYLWLAHSKLRPAAIGVEILLGELPKHINGISRIIRDNKIIWEKPFLSGEDNMSHSLDNLEYHHFKYGLFRKPGDIHVHCFGTATASFADGIQTKDGDIFEIIADAFRYGLRNTLETEAENHLKLKVL